MALQNLTLRRSDGVRIFYPITKLCKEPIFNISRSANRWEGFKVDDCHIQLPRMQQYQQQQHQNLQTLCRRAPSPRQPCHAMDPDADVRTLHHAC